MSTLPEGQESSSNSGPAVAAAVEFEDPAARIREVDHNTPSQPEMEQPKEEAIAASAEAEAEAAIEAWRNKNNAYEKSRGDLFDVEDPSSSLTNTSPPPARSVQRQSSTSVIKAVEEQLHIKKSYKRLRLWYREKVQPFWKIAFSQLLCVVYILVVTFTPPPLGITDPETGNIIDPNSEANTADGVVEINGALRPVVAVGGWQKFCLAVSRMSAFSMYPMLVIVFITKMKAIQTFFSKTHYSMYFAMIKEGHDYHVYAGHYIAFDVWIHTTFHVLRWLSQGNISLLGTTAAGITGLITIVLTPIIAFPMMYWRRRLNYELRKGLHFLFYAFAVVMCFHVPPSAIPNGGFLPFVLGGCIVLYALDTFYVSLFMTEKIETTSFAVLSTGVRISMPVSERFRRNAAKRGGFAYINLPWINDKQWHPFSLFEDPDDASIQQMFLMKSGDWTTAVHSSLSRDTTRPVWIRGPFPSPFGHAALYDNQILVASGIGITPALGAINAFKSSRRINLIWAVRDPEMLEFFLEKMYLEHDGWNLIFYTGKKPLNADVSKLNTNIKVIKGRPKLDSVIPNVIYGIESKEGLPEKYTSRSKDEMKVLLANRVVELQADLSMRATEKVAKIQEYGEFLGFSLSEMIKEIDRALDEEIEIANGPDAVVSATPSDSKLPTTAEKDDAGKNSNGKGAANLHSSIKYVKKNSYILDDIFDDEPVAEDAPSGAEAPVVENRAEAFLNELQTSVIGYAKRQSTSSTNVVQKNAVSSRANKSIRRKSSDLMWSTMVEGVDKGDSTILKPAFCPWEVSPAQERCVARFDDDIMSTWGIMYCGGSQPVISALKDISIDFDIDLHIDSFAW